MNRRTFLRGLALAAGAAALGPSEGLAFVPRDPLRPRFHLQPASGWMNDPCGPIFWQGRYHMFYQHNPAAPVPDNIHWGHAVSTDMVQWKRLPIALSPTPGGPDAAGCFTGSIVVDRGAPTLLYTGVREAPPEQATLNDGTVSLLEAQCLATAADAGLVRWHKRAQPVIEHPPFKVAGFRDPCPWRHGDAWMLLVASGERGKGGELLLYRSQDLREWTYLHPFCSGTWSGDPGPNPVDTGEMWECPDFFPLGDRHVLIHSTQGKSFWQSGHLDPHALTFKPQHGGQLDWGSFYAPKTQLDRHGNRVLWGWIPEGEEHEAVGWAGMLSLPRRLTLEDGRLRMTPAPELETLRGAVGPGQEFLLSVAPGQGLNLGVGGHLTVSSSAELDSSTLLLDGAPLHLGEPLADTLQLRVFVDQSVMEIFVGAQAVITRRFYGATGNELVLPGHRSGTLSKFALRGIW